MTEQDFLVFAALFKEAYKKCFGNVLDTPMTETESRVFTNHINELTGLSIGWKSVKNYSFFVLDGNSVKQENPSTATLDTLARYVLGAPYTNEIKRKDNESHHPYWFLYRKQFQPAEKPTAKSKAFPVAGVVIAIITVASLILFFIFRSGKSSSQTFTDNFSNVSDQALENNGWFEQAKDNIYWKRKNEKPDALTLFTLEGDNWPEAGRKPGISNLLLRSIPSDCFTAEIHLDNFIPHQEWQQAGILLLEDTTFNGKSIRLSLAYNDFFGGYTRPHEILVQAITSLGNGFGKPEEIAHHVVFYPDSANGHPGLFKNLQNTALRIEKHGSRFRFLYAGGSIENTAFKEVISQDIDMHPRYIGLFAIKGFKKESADIPVCFKFFQLFSTDCNR
ncbi:hypothetical protein ACFFGT_20005 [Mucilaginibacter angelicae]|uniref:Beta-xylosidase C-terminal Concanavalin A-like domain-containing protein n=1 Tax=Mucilaginibacter angelicae TaxID=869718 RepID=A0ABV6LAP2_9SPHI